MSLYEHGSPVGPCSFEVEDMTSFTITDVGNLLGIERLSGGDDASYNVVCPFCGDRRGKCNFVVYKDGELANVYHCFHCDAAGNMLTLYVAVSYTHLDVDKRQRWKRAFRYLEQADKDCQ